MEREHAQRDMRSAVSEAAGAEVSRRLPRLLLGPARADANGGLEPELEALAAVVADIGRELRAQRELLVRILDEDGRCGSSAAQAEPVWLLVPTAAGYVVSEYEPTAPLNQGSIVSLDDVEYRVAVVGRSLFPDGRTCLYLEPPHHLGASTYPSPAPASPGLRLQREPAAAARRRPLGR